MKSELENPQNFWRKLSWWYWGSKTRKLMWQQSLILGNKRKKKIIALTHKKPKRETEQQEIKEKNLSSFRFFNYNQKPQKLFCHVFYDLATPLANDALTHNHKMLKNHQQRVKMNFNPRDPAGNWNPRLFFFSTERKQRFVISGDT